MLRRAPTDRKVGAPWRFTAVGTTTRPSGRERAITKATVTLALPESVYIELRQRADQHQRRIEDEAAETLVAAIDNDDGLPPDLTAAIDALARLDVDSLWRVSRSQPTVEDSILLDALVDKRRRLGTTPGE